MQRKYQKPINESRRPSSNEADWTTIFVETGDRCPDRCAVGRMVLVARSVLSHTAARTPGGLQAVDFEAKHTIFRGDQRARLRKITMQTGDIASSNRGHCT
jgi:hypothetical protein